MKIEINNTFITVSENLPVEQLLPVESSDDAAFLLQNSPYDVRAKEGQCLNMGYTFAALIAMRKPQVSPYPGERQEHVKAWARKVKFAYSEGGQFWEEFLRRMAVMRDFQTKAA